LSWGARLEARTTSSSPRRQLQKFFHGPLPAAAATPTRGTPVRQMGASPSKPAPRSVQAGGSGTGAATDANEIVDLRQQIVLVVKMSTSVTVKVVVCLAGAEGEPCAASAAGKEAIALADA